MALGDPYATLATLKTRLNITDTNDDAAATLALNSASLQIEGVCGRQFNDAGSATARIYYPDSPTTVSVDDFSTTNGLILQADYGNDGVFEFTWLSTNYQVEPINGVFDGTPGWPFYRIRAINQYYPLWWGPIGAPRASLQVTAQWGWAAVPAGVQEACLLLAEEIFKLKDAPFGVAGFGAMGAVRVRENPKVMALLERYIRTPILAR